MLIFSSSNYPSSEELAANTKRHGHDYHVIGFRALGGASSVLCNGCVVYNFIRGVQFYSTGHKRVLAMATEYCDRKVRDHISVTVPLT